VASRETPVADALTRARSDLDQRLGVDVVISLVLAVGIAVVLLLTYHAARRETLLPLVAWAVAYLCYFVGSFLFHLKWPSWHPHWRVRCIESESGTLKIEIESKQGRDYTPGLKCSVRPPSGGEYFNDSEATPTDFGGLQTFFYPERFTNAPPSMEDGPYQVRIFEPGRMRKHRLAMICPYAANLRPND